MSVMLRWVKGFAVITTIADGGQQVEQIILSPAEQKVVRRFLAAGSAFEEAD